MLRWYLAHYLFSGLFDCYIGISRAICFLVCLTVTLAPRALFVSWFIRVLRWHLVHYFFFFGFLTVTLVSHALCFFWFVWLLRWYLGHYFFSGFSNCYVGILRSVRFLVCSTVTLVSRALFFSVLFDCYVGISCTICSLVFFFLVFFFLHNMIGSFHGTVYAHCVSLLTLLLRYN